MAYRNDETTKCVAGDGHVMFQLNVFLRILPGLGNDNQPKLSCTHKVPNHRKYSMRLHSIPLDFLLTHLVSIASTVLYTPQMSN